ncbi:MAG: NADH-quinone oxidoreductase subunit M [Blastocatellia bacterium]|nr:NADH-quinone oxidoreductase subunit M [Blastocatellia bacterium]MCS7158516.1 NADH-quinone oxidoreductase subunit M [Blastocatellia bacterium]MDW8167805.1 NADH-quinone oxidoreductase subunit M [Acidobacteriota bacterium]MDW8257559.1 NADH-quinone oxidoreductase subunit M [Acidobacteriota bacterium]
MRGHLLSWLTFAPTAGALLLLVARVLMGAGDETIRRLALALSLIPLGLCVPLLLGFDPTASGPQMVERAPWIRFFGFNVDYFLGVDGLSLWFVVLSALLTTIAILASWRAIERHVLEFHIFLLLLETGLIGVFVALDMFLFFIFWEVMLVPMYFLIGIWGYERRIYAAVKFIIYTMVGSALMLAAIISLYYLNGGTTFDIPAITENVRAGRLVLDPTTERWLFWGFALAFLIKVPLFPFHTWLPDAHVEAPTAGSVILAGVLLKMGGYGLLRFNLPLFPRATEEFAALLCVLAIISIIYGALVSMVQPDLKKLIAYSSVSHMGFVVLGIMARTEMGMQGAIFQMLSHGISTGALFVIVGILSERRHTRAIAEFGGLARPMPVFSALFGILALASVALPTLSGFVGEFLVLVGTYTSDLAHARAYTVLAATAMILSAAYMLWMLERVLFGPITHEENQHLPDANGRERLALIPMAVLVIVMGVLPNPILRRTDQAVQEVKRAAHGAVLVQAEPAGQRAPNFARPQDAAREQAESLRRR